MKIEKERIIRVIFKALDEVNQLLPKEARLEKSVDAVLFGTSSSLDSLGFVNLIVAVEQGIEDIFEIKIALADERAMTQKNNPFKTIGTLADYIAMRFEEE